MLGIRPDAASIRGIYAENVVLSLQNVIAPECYSGDVRHPNGTVRPDNGDEVDDIFRV